MRLSRLTETMTLDLDSITALVLYADGLMIRCDGANYFFKETHLNGLTIEQFREYVETLVRACATITEPPRY